MNQIARSAPDLLEGIGRVFGLPVCIKAQSTKDCYTSASSYTLKPSLCLSENPVFFLP
jgi:hypothetical protein